MNEYDKIIKPSDQSEAICLNNFVPIKDYEDKYLINNNGDVYSIYSNKIITGKILRYYRSISEASRETGIHISGISFVIRDKGKTSGGFKWKTAT